MAKKILIVGGVAGGASAAARLRRLDENAEIIIFERGPFISFANCGLPYYIGQTIKERDDLLLMTPQLFNKRFKVDVRVNKEVIKIDRDKKLIGVKDLNSGKNYSENYDKLILSPGAEPSKPPIEGIESDRIFTLRNVPDMDRIDKFIAKEKAKRAVVVGAGYIGLEMAENLRSRGMLVAIVEMTDQVMPVLDKEMANLLQKNLQEHSIALWLDDAVRNFKQTDSHLFVGLKSGMELCCDFAILAIGVKPEVKLAKEAGLEIGSRLGIKVNEYLQTNDPDIYAIGDAVEVKDFILGQPTLIPLAGPANKQGRMAADNICGKKRRYNGTLGTSILKLFDQAVAMTGASEKALKKTDIDYEKLYIHPANHVGYYPGAKQMHIKLLFSKPEGKILGAQIIGSDGVDRRIDIFAVAIRAGMTVFDLQELDLAYAPPYGSGKDAVNMAGFAASNILDDTIKAVHWNQLDDNDFILDVRTKKEFDGNNVPGAVNISFDELRNNLEKLPKDKVINAYCGVGIRSYIAVRILMQNGFNVRNIAGGYLTYLSFTDQQLCEPENTEQLKKEFCTGF
ncbi:MAG: CoA-disulfide reductase [Planctomycetes bacterium]|nr:CoA-disulfide reductase [Planctomycetota bacterium]